MAGYLGNEKATADTIDNYGWLHTGTYYHFPDFLKLINNFYIFCTFSTINTRHIANSLNTALHVLLPHRELFSSAY